VNPFARLFIAAHTWLYRATDGKVGGSMGGPVMLLTTTGAKSGRPRTVPVMYFDDGGDRVVVASAGGSPKHPAWFNNIARQPSVTVQVGQEHYPARAEVVTGAERERIWRKVVGLQPRFAAYANKTAGRAIPLVRLQR